MPRRPKKRRPQRALSPSAKALAALLEDDAMAEALEAEVHRTMLWRWTTGRGLPDLESAALLEEITEGKCPAKGWVPEVARARSAAKKAVAA